MQMVVTHARLKSTMHLPMMYCMLRAKNDCQMNNTTKLSCRPGVTGPSFTSDSLQRAVPSCPVQCRTPRSTVHAEPADPAPWDRHQPP